ncbi:MAG: IS1 family transposase [Cytophagales bacterium]|jgi:insertion element IS1 protein InsB|nr:IS1 family transposase [Cytophagales bacterium]
MQAVRLDACGQERVEQNLFPTLQVQRLRQDLPTRLREKGLPTRSERAGAFDERQRLGHARDRPCAAQRQEHGLGRAKKKIEAVQVNPRIIDKTEAGRYFQLGEIVFFSVSIDEQWSYVGSKQNQHWLWYAIEKHSGKVLAFAFGKRSDEAFAALKQLLSRFRIRWHYTDSWGGHQRHLWDSGHKVGKAGTQDIERKNLDLRTRIKRLQRRTIGFSKSEEIHDKLIGYFINRYMF